MGKKHMHTIGWLSAVFSILFIAGDTSPQSKEELEIGNYFKEAVTAKGKEYVEMREKIVAKGYVALPFLKKRRKETKVPEEAILAGAMIDRIRNPEFHNDLARQEAEMRKLTAHPSFHPVHNSWTRWGSRFAIEPEFMEHPEPDGLLYLHLEYVVKDIFPYPDDKMAYDIAVGRRLSVYSDVFQFFEYYPMKMNANEHCTRYIWEMFDRATDKEIKKACIRGVAMVPSSLAHGYLQGLFKKVDGEYQEIIAGEMIVRLWSLNEPGDRKRDLVQFLLDELAGNKSEQVRESIAKWFTELVPHTEPNTTPRKCTVLRDLQAIPSVLSALENQFKMESSSNVRQAISATIETIRQSETVEK